MRQSVIIACVIILVAALQSSSARRLAAQVGLSARIEAVKSPADHEAIASDLEQEAKELDAKAALHTEMANKYATGRYPRQQKLKMTTHCEELSASLRKAAELAREMAKVHHELAQTAGK